MAFTEHRSLWTRLTQRVAQFVFVSTALASFSNPARADVCFPTPVALPGLSGVPIWQGAVGVVRTELNEPRWAAAPQTAFESDATGNEGLYRIVVDPTFSELVVSFQAPTDLGSPSNADVIYFGFTTDGPAGNLAKGVVIQVNSSGATDPTPAAVIQQQTYNAGATPKWTGLLGAPTWLKDASVWRNNVAGDAAWGVNFKVDLGTAGLSASTPFKIQLALHKQDELNVGNSVNLSTPDPGLNALLAGTLFIADPTKWSPAVAINSGCAAGITLNGSQIGTKNVDMGNPAPNEINTTLGAVNQFYATPTIPASVPLFAGEFQAKFHIANWGSIAASNAPWTPLPNGTAVLNGAAPAPNDSTLEFNCPANTATTTCGIPTPAETHQCVYVELKSGPGQSVPFTTAAAYRNMDFKPLSTFSAPAEISVKGLKQVFGNDLPRDVYVYIYSRNMPAQGNQPLFLPTEKMAATRRFFETPPIPVRHVERIPVGAVGLNPQKLAVVKPAPVAKPATAAKPSLSAAAVLPTPKANPAAVSQKLPEVPLPHTGIGDLDLNPRQALSAVWPTYDVHVYYDSGKTITIGGVTTKQLVPMFPFTYFHSHEGPLFGFSHGFQLASGAELKQLRPDVYLITIPSEGTAHVVTSATAHDTPKDGSTTECPKGPPPVEKNVHCGCRIPGEHSGDSETLFGLFAASALGIAFLRRRRAGRA